MAVPPIVTTRWLSSQLDNPAVRVVDASWHMPAAERDPAQEFIAAHIPGALFFDIDGISDPASPLPHMLPSAEAFGAAVGALGIDNASHVVAYDSVGLFSAPRAWWMFRAFGHTQVSVLGGGLPAWKSEDRSLDFGPARPEPATFEATLDPSLVRSLADVRNTLASGAAQIVDARSPGRFAGSEPEPRPGLRGGHMPGSFNVPYQALLTDEGTLRDAEGLCTAFTSAGVSLEKPIVTSCGSGISACLLSLGLHTVGITDVAVYDGSWTEWAGRADTPIESAADTP